MLCTRAPAGRRARWPKLFAQRPSLIIQKRPGRCPRCAFIASQSRRAQAVLQSCFFSRVEDTSDALIVAMLSLSLFQRGVSARQYVPFSSVRSRKATRASLNFPVWSLPTAYLAPGSVFVGYLIRPVPCIMSTKVLSLAGMWMGFHVFLLLLGLCRYMYTCTRTVHVRYIYPYGVYYMDTLFHRSSLSTDSHCHLSRVLSCKNRHWCPQLCTAHVCEPCKYKVSR